MITAKNAQKWALCGRVCDEFATPRAVRSGDSALFHRLKTRETRKRLPGSDCRRAANWAIAAPPTYVAFTNRPAQNGRPLSKHFHFSRGRFSFLPSSYRFWKILIPAGWGQAQLE